MSAREQILELKKRIAADIIGQGDAFSRTHHLQRARCSGNGFPRISGRQIDGLSIYPKAPEVFDQADRGTLLG